MAVVVVNAGVTTTVVWVRHGALERPVLRIEEKPNDVQIIIRSERNEHVSLHRAEDGVIVTYYAPDMASSTHDANRISAARAAGYRDPERHADYVMHRYLWNGPIVGMEGHELCGRRITLERASAKRKYDAMPRIVIDAPSTEFMLTFILATPEQPYPRPEEPHVDTTFGQLYFRAEPG